MRRVSADSVLPLSKVYPQTQTGQLIALENQNIPVLREYWRECYVADSFAAPASFAKRARQKQGI